MFPLYITISPKCWFGRHDWAKWMAYSRETNALESYGICGIRSKERYWYKKAKE